MELLRSTPQGDKYNYFTQDHKYRTVVICDDDGTSRNYGTWYVVISRERNCKSHRCLMLSPLPAHLHDI